MLCSQLSGSDVMLPAAVVLLYAECTNRMLMGLRAFAATATRLLFSQVCGDNVTLPAALLLLYAGCGNTMLTVLLASGVTTTEKDCQV